MAAQSVALGRGVYANHTERTEAVVSDQRITTIRDALLPSNVHHDRCNAHLGKPCDCYFSQRRDGKVAHDALAALERELADTRAENERLQDRMSMAAEILTRPPDTTNALPPAGDNQ
jgi:hypothetical protein